MSKNRKEETMRHLGILFALLSAVGFVAWLLVPARQSGPIENVLLITLDTTRADRLGCYGYGAARTPALDELARKGVLFEQCRTVTPLTLPSHATILTGLLPPEHGLRVNGGVRLQDNIPTMATILSTNGATSAAFIASPVLTARHGLSRGFPVYDDQMPKRQPGGRRPGPDDPEYYYRPGDQVVSSALEWLESNADERFFCWVHLYDPHEPYSAHSDTFRKEFSDNYDAEIAFMDLQIARLVKWLKKRGLADSTMIIAVGDHGEDLYEHGEPTHSLTLYDTTLHVPLIVYAPGVSQKGHRVTAQVGVEDLYPTIMEMVPWLTPDESGSYAGHGTSLRAAIEGQTIASGICYAEADEPYTEYGWAPLRSLSADGWKYIETAVPELYDLVMDPSEKNNLIESNPDKLAALRTQLVGLKRDMVMTKPGAVALSVEDLRRLRSLGYAGNGSVDSSKEVPESDRWAELKDIKTMLPVYQQGWALLNRLERQGDTSDEMLKECHKLVAKSPETPRFRRLVANVMLARGQMKEAATWYRMTLKKRPGDLESLSKMGVVQCRLGRIDEGIKYLQRAIVVNPNESEVRNNLGYALMLKHRVADAVPHFLEAIRIDPAYSEAHMNLASAYASLGSFQEAIDQGSRAVEIAVADGDERLAAQVQKRISEYQRELDKTRQEETDGEDAR